MQKLQSEFTQLAEEHARLKTLHEEKANEVRTVLLLAQVLFLFL